ncbi:ABC transporter substrate-binding protein [Ktedonosporobacter rubrisoli]|uniref:ABC transporter substrate-binding protein n=1 Tax=Ktedonosporobacter rubrisoli TaxID=2509675 RepID=UPI0013EE4531|nr:ABC transporter substrate-binding protein [Ktedonosporobacter rubrisoli]
MLICWLMVALSVAACGGAPSTPSGSVPNMTLRVAQNTNSISFFPFYVAEQKQFFTKEGVTLDPSPPSLLGTGPKLTAALESNSIDVAAGSVTDAFTLSRVDSYIKIVGTFADAFLLDIIVSKQFERQTHLSASSSLAEKVQALVGKKIGISSPGSTNDALVTFLLRQQGLDALRDVTKVSLGGNNPATGLGALAQGRVDALAFPVPVGQEAEAQGIGDIFISPARGDVPEMQGQLYGVLFARQQTLDAKPKAVQAFIRGLAQAEKWIHQNPTQAKALLGKYLKQNQEMTAAIFQACLPGLPQSPQISQQAYTTANQFHVKAGLIAIALPYQSLVATDTITKALSGLPGSA